MLLAAIYNLLPLAYWQEDLWNALRLASWIMVPYQNISLLHECHCGSVRHCLIALKIPVYTQHELVLSQVRKYKLWNKRKPFCNSCLPFIKVWSFSSCNESPLSNKTIYTSKTFCNTSPSHSGSPVCNCYVQEEQFSLQHYKLCYLNELIYDNRT